MKKVKKIAIVGVGLIGGSIGLAIKRKRLAKEVIGIGHRKSSIRKAIRLKAVDKGTLNLKSGVKDADIIILATPVLMIPKMAAKLKRSVKKGAIITDVGSTKSFLTNRLEKILPKHAHFVGAHPMAGSEKRGVDKARSDLFKNSICVITKTRKTNKSAFSTIKSLWSRIGAKTVVLDPNAHDRIISEVSHLPHMVVFALLNAIEKKSLKLASTGLRDTTRIASSDALVWKDIAISNKHEILKSIKKFKSSLGSLERAIRSGSSGKLLSTFNKAKAKRDDYCS